MSLQAQTVSRPPFGTWLLTQTDRTDWIGDLAKAAQVDRGFPRHGSPDDVRARLTAVQAEGEVFEALESAEIDWLAY